MNWLRKWEFKQKIFAHFVMSVPRIFCDRIITPPNMLPHVANYGRHPECVTIIREQLGRQCMCDGWLYDSNLNGLRRRVFTDVWFLCGYCQRTMCSLGH